MQNITIEEFAKKKEELEESIKKMLNEFIIEYGVNIINIRMENYRVVSDSRERVYSVKTEISIG